MIPRRLENVLRKAAKEYPAVTLTGPRQSGKTTLVRQVFAAHEYVSLEAPDVRQFALEDPRGFLNQFKGGVILDEVQRTPDLLSYVQGIVDEHPAPGHFVLTGSQNFLLLQRVTQSLAGRTCVLHLLPFSFPERSGRKGLPLESIGVTVPRRSAPKETLFDVLFTGSYPRIHDKGLEPQTWLRNYYQTYIERDVRSILNVGDLETFGRFVRLCAGRAGQLINLSSLAADCGVSHVTAKRWLSVLEASFLVYQLRPHHRNFNKRLMKSPKLYFLDTGLLCYLLRIRSPEELRTHAARGPIFESFVVSEALKAYHNRGREPDIYFWRDSVGHEIDLLLEEGADLIPVEVKSGETIASDFFNGPRFWRTLPGQEEAPSALVYGGDSSSKRNEVAVHAWHHWVG